jgi:integrase
MPRQFLLTWDKSLRQWVKQVEGKKYYFGVAASKSDAAGYERALTKFRQFMAARAATESAHATPKQLLSGSGSVASANPNRSLGRIVQDYLAYQQDRTIPTGNGRAITPGRVVALRNWIKPFVRLCGETRRMNTIGEDLILSYRRDRYDALTRSEITSHTLFQHFAVVRHFLKWCWENRKIRNLPRNLGSALKLGLPTPSKILFFDWKAGEVQKLLRACAAHSEELELCVLLGLNCGFTLKDISDLRMSEFRWRKDTYPRISRSRSKTGQYASHVLWDRTLELLKKHAIGKYGSDERCLLRPDGRPLLMEYKGKTNNRIHGWFRKVMNATFGEDDERSFRTLRKTGATFLRRRKEGTEVLYLAHQPSSMASKFYALTPPNLLDEWLCYMEVDFGLRATVARRWEPNT